MKHTYRINDVQHLREFFTKFSQLGIYPVEITIDDEPSNKRSINQNRLQRLWIGELAKQGDMNSEQYRAYSKLHFGVPILRNECDDFKAQYDRVIRPLPYESKMDLMMCPIDFPVTRLMSSKQKTQYLDAMYHHWTSQGFHLTRPDDVLNAGVMY